MDKLSEAAIQHAPLLNQLAIVTGASSGIGAATAIGLAKAGANVVIHARQNEQGLAQTAATISEMGRQCHHLIADLGSDAGRREFCESAAELGPIDCWINNAGADVLTGSAAEMSFADKFEMLWQVDVLGTVQLSRWAGAAMKTRGSGVILNVGWDQAWTGMEGESGEMFATIKGAIMSFTKSLARSLAPQVRVNCVAPGWIRTAWGEQASAEWDARARRESLMNRWGTAEDVAAAMVYLASPAADFVTGHILPVNGGFRGG